MRILRQGKLLPVLQLASTPKPYVRQKMFVFLEVNSKIVSFCCLYCSYIYFLISEEESIQLRMLEEENKLEGSVRLF